MKIPISASAVRLLSYVKMRQASGTLGREWNRAIIAVRFVRERVTIINFPVPADMDAHKRVIGADEATGL